MRTLANVSGDSVSGMLLNCWVSETSFGTFTELADRIIYQTCLVGGEIRCRWNWADTLVGFLSS